MDIGQVQPCDEYTVIFGILVVLCMSVINGLEQIIVERSTAGSSGSLSWLVG